MKGERKLRMEEHVKNETAHSNQTENRLANEYCRETWYLCLFKLNNTILQEYFTPNLHISLSLSLSLSCTPSLATNQSHNLTIFFFT